MLRFPAKPRRRLILAGFGLGWAIAVTAGAGWLTSYQMTPGNSATARAAWPGAGVCKLAADRPTLLMFVHPQCPCSRASLGELQQLMTTCGNRVAAMVLFYEPLHPPAGWNDGGLWNDAQAIGGIEVADDTDGRLARLFGARTSGQVLVYSPAGRLIFNGGITDGRGHLGGNAGLDAALAVVRGSATAESAVVTSNVYGCPLTSPGESNGAVCPLPANKP